MTHPLKNIEPAELEAKVRAAISRTSGGIEVNHAINEDMELDSLAIVEASIEIEDEFDIRVPDDALEEFSGKSVGDWCEFVSGLLAGPKVEAGY